MASGRMLNKSICVDLAVNELSSDACRLAFTWAICHLDREGRMSGDPEKVRKMVLPLRKDITNEHVMAFIKEWTLKQLAIWYEVRGEKWLCFPKFHKNQQHLRYNREAESKIPPPDSGPDRTGPEKEEEKSKEESNKEEKKREEERLEDSEASPAAAPPVPFAFPKPTKQDRDTRVKKLVDYFSAGFQKRCGFPPTINWGAWGKIFKCLLKQCDLETIENVIDTFFAYDKRTRFTIYDFERAFDNVYGHLYRQVHGVKRA